MNYSDPNGVGALNPTPTVLLPKVSESLGISVYAKLESCQPTGSIKDRVAHAIVATEMTAGNLRAGDRIIESSSGNMAISLASIARRLNLAFTAVVSHDLDQITLTRLKLLDSEVIQVRPTPNESDLAARIRRVHDECRARNLYWINQYNHPAAVTVHMETTFPELFRALSRDPDYLFVPVSTCATALAAKRFISEVGASTTLILVDATGSVLFQGSKGERDVPGLGAGVVTPFSEQLKGEVVLRIETAAAWQATRDLARLEGVLVGGSSGAAYAAAKRYLQSSSQRETTVAIICPDGDWRYCERYLGNLSKERT